MKKVRIGVIGAGRIGKLHAQSIIRNVPGAEVVAISDVIMDGLEDFARSLGIPNVYSDYNDILKDSSIDAVIICSSTNTHCEITVAAAKAGKHIFCEKPIDLDIAKIKDALAAVEKAGVKMQIGFNRRFDHNHKAVRDLVASGAIGDVHIVKITSRDPAPPPPAYIAVSGGLFLDMTVHDFDMALYQAGSEVVEVYAKGAVLVDPEIGKLGDVDTAVVVLTFANGALGVIDNSRKAVYGYDQRVEVFGSKGALINGNDVPHSAVLLGEQGVVSQKPLYFFLERYMQSYADEMTAFIDAIAGDKPVPIDPKAGLDPIVIAKACQLSMKENRPVKISEIK